MQFFLRKSDTSYWKSTSPSLIFTREVVVAFSLLFLTIFYPSTAGAGLFSDIKSDITTVVIDRAAAKTQDVDTSNLQNMTLVQAAVNSDPNPNNASQTAVVSGNALVPEISPSATVLDVDNETSTQISTYVVRKGDSLSKIASMFNVTVSTIVWANDLGVKPVIREGDTLLILPISGVRHTVKKGDTIKGIVLKYRADLEDVLSYNNLTTSSIINAGDILIIPDGEVTVTTSKTTTKTSTTFKDNPVHDANGPSYAGYYMRPITAGRRSQGLHGYNGVDLAAPIGTPIYASAGGTVIASMTGGWNGGYGNYVIISHPNGTQTLYAHNRENLVVPGQTVEKGDMIARIGITGKTSGPHVHFEIRGARNPF